MEENKRMNEQAQSLIEVIHFTENMTTKIYGVLDEAEIYRVVKEEFAKSKRYDMTIFLLTEDRSKVRVAESSIPFQRVGIVEKLTGLGSMKEYKMDLDRSSILSKVIREGETVQANVDGILSEFFPRILVFAMLKIIGYENRSVIVTPLKRHDEIIGALLVSSTELSEYFIPSVRTFAQHVSIALELADAYTERRKAEEKLSESEEKYRVLVENSPNLVLIYQEGHLKYVNEAACKMLGWTSEELTSPTFKVIEGLIPERFQALIKENIAKRLNGEEIPPYELSLKTRDNIEFPVTVQAQRILYQGKFAEEIILINITERKKMDEELSLKAQLLDAATDSIFLHDFDGNFFYVNEAACRSHDYSRDELLKMNLHELDVPESAKLIEPRIRELMEKGEAIFESAHFCKNKSIMQTEVHARIIETEGRKLILSVTRDITERKRIEGALRETRNYLENLITYANAPIIVWNPNYGVTHFNNAFERLTGLRAGEVLGKELDILFPEDSREESLKCIRRTVTGEHWEVEEIPVLCKDGTVRTVLWNSATLFAEDGKTVVSTIAQGQDITELKEAQTKFEQYSKHLEELVEERTKALNETHERLLVAEHLATIGEVAAMVGHDLRNPLQVIVNTLYAAGKKAESLSIKDREIVDKIGFLEFRKTLIKQGEYMNSIVSNLQEYARQLKPKLVETDLHHLINDILSTIAVPENIAVSTLIGDDFPLLMIDSLMMRRVFTNLASNAVQAMPEGGKLTIRASKTGEDVLISFEDTGVGISEENLSKLFSPLFTTKAKGTGFGLAVCKRMVEANEGSITVESRVSKGSTFTIRMPLRMEVNTNG